MTVNPESPPAARIFVVDDEPATLQLLTEVLEDQGYDVRPFPSGQPVLEAARREPPDLVLLDINMPGLSGFEVCAQLKGDPRLAAVPVIFLSGRADARDKVKGLELGAIDYVTIPFSVAELEARVRTHLELARLRRELEGYSAHLEEMVARRTQELATSRANLQEAHNRLAILDRAKTDFLQLISHEVRTPLTGIFGVAELLLAGSGDSPEAAGYAELYEQSRRRMMTLIDDALLLCQIGVGTAPSAQQSCPLQELLDVARAQASPVAQSRGVAIAPVPPQLDVVEADRGYLIRALQSLLETAVKFARAGSVVRLATETVPEGVCLVIEAEGQGIPSDALPRFFELLAIATPIAKGGDLGLAPALAERVITLCGGAVHVENVTPPGVRFVVQLKAGRKNDPR